MPIEEGVSARASRPGGSAAAGGRLAPGPCSVRSSGQGLGPGRCWPGQAPREPSSLPLFPDVEFAPGLRGRGRGGRWELGVARISGGPTFFPRSRRHAVCCRSPRQCCPHAGGGRGGLNADGGGARALVSGPRRRRLRTAALAHGRRKWTRESDVASDSRHCIPCAWDPARCRSRSTDPPRSRSLLCSPAGPGLDCGRP